MEEVEERRRRTRTRTRRYASGRWLGEERNEDGLGFGLGGAMEGFPKNLQGVREQNEPTLEFSLLYVNKI